MIVCYFLFDSFEQISVTDASFHSEPMEVIKLKAIEKGKVYFVGAGPGDPFLIIQCNSEDMTELSYRLFIDFSKEGAVFSIDQL